MCNPWITKGIITSIKIRNKLIRKKYSLGLSYKSKIKRYIKVFNGAIEYSFKKSVYSALIQSHLQYATTIWGEKNNLNQLHSLQNSITSKFNIKDIVSMHDLLNHKLKK